MTGVWFVAVLIHFIFAKISRLVLVPAQPPTEWVPEVLFPGIKSAGHTFHHLAPSGANVKK
jgi:hypothetical protein